MTHLLRYACTSRSKIPKCYSSFINNVFSYSRNTSSSALCLLPVRRVNLSSMVKNGYKNMIQMTKRKCHGQSGLGLKAVNKAGLCVGMAVFCGSSYGRTSWQVHCASKKNKLRTVVNGEDTEEGEPVFPWKEFFNVVWPDIIYLIGAVLSAFVVAMINIKIPLELGEVVNVVSKFTKGEVGDFIQDIKGPAIRLIQMYGLQSLFTFLYITQLSTVGERSAARLRKQLFAAVIKQDVAFFDTHKTGEIVNRLTADVQDFKSSFKMCVSQGLRCFTQVIGCVVSVFLISPRLTLTMVVVVPSIIGFGSLIGSVLRRLSRMAQAQVSKATGVADEAIGNVRTVRAFAMEPKEIELYGLEVDESSRLNQRLGVGIGMFQGLSNLALNGIVLGTLFVGGKLMSQNQLKPGDLMSFMVATQTLQRSLGQMSLMFGQAVRGVSAGARVFEYLLLDCKMSVTGGFRIPYHSMVGDLQFQNVSFTYPARPNQVILKDFNLDIKGGSMVALVGLSGGGKSTVASLLERFYDVQSGSISLDGHDIRSLDPAWLRGKVIGFINQEPVLFATSVMENIRYGRPDATDDEVMEAAVQANADGFIRSFPNGYNTIVGERGVTVSGGQKQRIAIARALIKNPAILILDEATSALDAESERIVQETLDKVIKGRTVLVIAHRLSTIKNANVIAVVADGEIKEMGTHEVLRKKKGVYWELIKKQDGDQEDKQGFFSRRG